MENTLTFMASYLAVREALDWLAARITELGLAELVDDVGIATSEALTNVCRHAYGEGKGGKITLTIAPLRGGCRVTVTDTGRAPPVKLFTQSDNRVADDWPERGMGIPLILSIARDVRLDRQRGMTVLHLTFARQGDE